MSSFNALAIKSVILNFPTSQAHTEDRLRQIRVEPLIEVVKRAQLRDPRCQAQMQRPNPRQVIRRGVLWEAGVVNPTEYRVYVPVAARGRVLNEFHDKSTAGHPGILETTRAIQTQYQWPGITQDTKKYVRACQICTDNKPFLGRELERPGDWRHRLAS